MGTSRTNSPFGKRTSKCVIPPRGPGWIFVMMPVVPCPYGFFESSVCLT
jgi:hypothetical protein